MSMSSWCTLGSLSYSVSDILTQQVTAKLGRWSSENLKLQGSQSVQIGEPFFVRNEINRLAHHPIRQMRTSSSCSNSKWVTTLVAVTLLLFLETAVSAGTRLSCSPVRQEPIPLLG